MQIVYDRKIGSTTVITTVFKGRLWLAEERMLIKETLERPTAMFITYTRPLVIIAIARSSASQYVKIN